jgi:acyl-CoA synthetase (AMP-forming)/AMP-acid ligase II
MAELTPLSSWLTNQPDYPVAMQSGQPISAAAFSRRVQEWIHIIQTKERTRWAVYHSDASEFLAILFAIWQLQRVACVPGDNRPGTVQRLAGFVDGFIGEFPIESLRLPDAPQQIATPVEWQPLDTTAISLEIYTSGSTGEPKPISKTLGQLEQEISVLESLWPSQQGCTVLGSVSHQHIYGMTFRLFWPLCSGRAFETTLCEYTEDILHLAAQYNRFELISSPSHLGRFNASLNWASIAPRCHSLTSSAAPLARQDSLIVSRLLNTPVREIYGSSETGAIAWRTQEAMWEAIWQALPRVHLSATTNNTLSVTSPYLKDQEQLTLPDLVEFSPQGGFKILGRVDRIVKVEGKRVSLAAVEQHLLENSCVDYAKALTVTRNRVETAVVIQLSDSGWQQLQRHGRKPLINDLKKALAEHFEAVVLPRRWRFVQQLPYNLQGKLPLDSLQSMFEKKHTETVINESTKWPSITTQSVENEQATLHAHIPADLIYFDGHFAEKPILPGIVQIHWAEAYGRQLLSVTGQFKRLEAIKFQKVIPPGQAITITLSYNIGNQKLSFNYESDKGVHSSGRLCFE